MNLLKLTERSAHTLRCCKHLKADVGSEESQRALAAALDALRKHPPTAPPLVMGLFNQCIALGDGVVHAVARASTSPTPEDRVWAQRSLAQLLDCVGDLHATAARPARTVGREAPITSLPTRTTLRRA